MKTALFTYHVFITGELLHFPLTPPLTTGPHDKQGAMHNALAEIERASGLNVSAEVEVRRVSTTTDRSQRIFLFTCKPTRASD